MSAIGKWRIAVMIAGAMVLGLLLGVPVVRAASAALAKAHAGNPVRTAPADRAETAVYPGSPVLMLARSACGAGGDYKVPPGKVLIITSVNFYNIAAVNGDPVETDLLDGPASHPCKTLLASGLDTDITLSVSQNFQPGIPVRTGQSLGVRETNSEGTAEIYGYLVPSADVPAGAAPRAPATRARR
jgi:hypothetical protein